MSDNAAAENHTAAESPVTKIRIPLRRPGVAALWAWLIPGAGHWYQGRRAKSVIYAVCILSTYFFGLAIGGGHVVYASLSKNDWRWQYFCQLGVGAFALPALVQTYRVRSGRSPLVADIMAPPGTVTPHVKDKLARWHEKYTSRFEIGTLYTMVAGLMNLLAVFDAYGGPFVFVSAEPQPAEPARSAKSDATPSRARKRKKQRHS